MNYIVYLVPVLVLLGCAALYFIENKATQKKWLCSVVIVILHIFIIIYFLFVEFSMEISLLFLLASLALAISVKPPKQ